MSSKIWECVTKGSSRRVNSMEKERLFNKEVKSPYTREDGSLGSSMDREDILLVEISITMENGSMTREMGLEYILSLEVFTTDHGVKGAAKEREVLSLLVALNSRGVSKIMSLSEGLSNIQMEMSTQDKCVITSALVRKALICSLPPR